MYGSLPKDMPVFSALCEELHWTQNRNDYQQPQLLFQSIDVFPKLKTQLSYFEVVVTNLWSKPGVGLPLFYPDELTKPFKFYNSLDHLHFYIVRHYRSSLFHSQRHFLLVTFICAFN